jgi:uncharacterized protein YkwD
MKDIEGPMKTNYLLTGLFSLVIIAGILSFSRPENLVNDVLTYTNKFRKSKRLPPLEIREDLNAIAQKHTDNMAKGRVGFGHSGFDKREDQARKKFPGATHFAENVAYGSPTGEDVVDGWKKSAGHRRNMLGPYKYIGIGVARDKRGVLYYTQIFID